jgi:transcriptional regulator with XRE-family HTH domain
MTGDLQTTLGRRLRERRSELGISQKEFAERLGLQRSYVGALERGERNPTLQSLEKLAAGLGVDPSDLLEP